MIETILIACLGFFGITFIMAGATMIALSPPVPDTLKKKIIVKTVGLFNMVAGGTIIYFSPNMVI